MGVGVWWGSACAFTLVLSLSRSLSLSLAVRLSLLSVSLQSVTPILCARGRGGKECLLGSVTYHSALTPPSPPSSACLSGCWYRPIQSAYTLDGMLVVLLLFICEYPAALSDPARRPLSAASRPCTPAPCTRAPAHPRTPAPPHPRTHAPTPPLCRQVSGGGWVPPADPDRCWDAPTYLLGVDAGPCTKTAAQDQESSLTAAT